MKVTLTLATNLADHASPRCKANTLAAGLELLADHLRVCQYVQLSEGIGHMLDDDTCRIMIDKIEHDPLPKP